MGFCHKFGLVATDVRTHGRENVVDNNLRFTGFCDPTVCASNIMVTLLEILVDNNTYFVLLFAFT